MHIYESLSLAPTGFTMGMVLMLLSLYVLVCPEHFRRNLSSVHAKSSAGTVLLGIDFIWVALLLFKAEWNALCMPLFEFEGFRGILLLLCPVIWFVMSSMAKEQLFARALGMFLLLMAIVPMSAAFMKDPASRIIIPLWWYPVLTVAMFWVGKPYLFRDWMGWLVQRPRLISGIAVFNFVYGLVICTCAGLFW
ncbi:MAG: hypothetical protein J6J97_02910 [Akkermansia sp.]|nr:hypothetical protein [Akkermansia sp.]MBQ2868988.1 hypothetical protein [Akkermansia sp.]MBQ8376306.1 hypothetical protein [Akkermansia sp.]